MKPLNPIMAALLAASVGAVGLRTPVFGEAVAGKPVAPTGKLVASEDKNPVNALARILHERPDARADAGGRIMAFLLQADKSGESFVAAETKKDVLSELVHAWTQKARVSDVTKLYYVIGPGANAPPWAAKDPVLKGIFKLNPDWALEGRLRKRLEGEKIGRPLDKAAAGAFLNVAVEHAHGVLTETRTLAELEASIAANDIGGPLTPVVKPVVAGSGRSGLGAFFVTHAAPQRYSFDDLYRTGAAVGRVYGEGDKKSSEISLKIYTKRDAKGTLVNEIGIFDITNPRDAHGRRFALKPGEQDFELDDRTPGNKKYTLKIETDEDNKYTVVFGRPDAKAGEPGTIKTSVEDLFRARARQAVGPPSSIATVGGREFYVVPQGGEKGVLAFFAKNLLDDRDAKAWDLIPELYAEVSALNADGRTIDIPYKTGPQLGAIDGKEYHLVLKGGLWDVEAGAGDLPETSTKTTAGAAGDKSIAALMTTKLAEGCTLNEDDAKDLAQELRGQYQIVMCGDKAGGRRPIILVPKSKRFAQQEVDYPKGRSARFLDHYVVVDLGDTAQYMDLLKHDDEGLVVVGLVDTKTKRVAKPPFSSAVLFVDALKNFFGVTTASKDAEALHAVPRRVPGGKPYTLTGEVANGKLGVFMESGGKRFQLWPEMKELPPSLAASDADAKLSGPTNVLDGKEGVSSEDAPFSSKTELEGSYVVELMNADAQSRGIALYKSVDPLDDKKKPKKYFLSFRYYRDEKKTIIGRQQPFEAFSSEGLALPKNYDLQGLTLPSAPPVGPHYRYSLIMSPDKKKGVWAVFQNKQVGGDFQKDKAANCAGPIFWWGAGMDRAAALKVCREDKL